MKTFISPRYWFNMFPGGFSPLGSKVVLGLIVLSAVASAVFYFLSRKKKGSVYRKVYRKSYALFLFNAIFFAFIWFFNMETIPFFSSRFWFAVLAISDAIWFFFIVKEAMKIPERIEKHRQEQEYKKYIP